MLDDTTKQRVKELCDLISKEQDHNRFSLLIYELNQLLDGCDGAGKQLPSTRVALPADKSS